VSALAIYDAEEEWRSAALCRPGSGIPPGVWFPERGDTRGEERAKAICRQCPSLVECLGYALNAQEAHGIFGATTPDERARMLRRSRLPIGGLGRL